MDVTIDERFMQLIQDRVEAGANPDAAAVVNEALAALFERDQATLQAAIASGDAQAVEGRITRRTPGMLRRIFEEERDRLGSVASSSHPG